MSEVFEAPPKDEVTERVICIVFNVSPAQAGIISCLSRAKAATGEELLEFVGAKSSIKPVISRARQAVQKHGFDIHSKRNTGYWMTVEDQKGVQRLIDEFVGQA